MVFLGRAISEHRNYSDKIAQQIDEEVRRLVDEAYERCQQLLHEHWDKLELLADRLLELETIEARDFEALMRGEDPFEKRDDTPDQEPKPSESQTKGKERDSDGREDSGLDLGGDTLPAPA